MNTIMMILASGLPTLTGNLWTDSMVIVLFFLSAALLFKKVKDEFWPAENQANEMIISPSPLQIKKAPEVATKDDLDEIRKDIDDLKRQNDDQRNISRTSLSKIHYRIDGLAKQSDTMSGEMKGELAGIKTVLDKLLAKAMT